MKVKLFHRFIALLLVCNYLAFQIEPFEEEYERNHPLPSTVPTFSYSSFNWETFGKTDVPKAFTFNPAIQIILICMLRRKPAALHRAHKPFQLIRDKSPPQEAAISS